MKFIRTYGRKEGEKQKPFYILNGFLESLTEQLMPPFYFEIKLTNDKGNMG